MKNYIFRNLIPGAVPGHPRDHGISGTLQIMKYQKSELKRGMACFYSGADDVLLLAASRWCGPWRPRWRSSLQRRPEPRHRSGQHMYNHSRSV